MLLQECAVILVSCPVPACAASEAESAPRSAEEDLFHVDHHHLRHGPAHHRARACPQGPQRQHQTVPRNTDLQVSRC